MIMKTVKKNPYLMKEVVIKIHHGLEALFKDILFQANPVFLFEDEAKISKVIQCYQKYHESNNHHLFDDEKTKTINVIEALTRIQALFGDAISRKEYGQLINSFKEINKYRNQLQHFAIDTDPELIVKNLGNVIPAAISLLKSLYGAHLQNGNYLPHIAIKGMEHFYNAEANIIESLQSVFPDAEEAINHLQHKYSTLLREAIKNFKSISVADLFQRIEIVDSGKSGAPPYMPRIMLSGWVNQELDAYRNSHESSRQFYDTGISATYNAILDIGEFTLTPSIEKETHSFSTNILLNSDILVLDQTEFFKLKELSEHLPFIRKPKVELSISMKIKGLCQKDARHFYVTEVIEIEGFAEMVFSSAIYGDDEKSPTISGKQILKLDNKNTSLTYHAFVTSTGEISDRRTISITIDASSELNFK